MAALPNRTYLAFQHNGKLDRLKTMVKAIHPFSTLEEANRLLYKQGTDEDYVVVTEQTIFHPQGGGQPSDVGKMISNTSGQSFEVATVRMDAIQDGQVLHFGRFPSSATTFQVGDEVEQAIDAETRLLYSRLLNSDQVGCGEI